MKEEKGITLIALIITIIVMLILVVVSVAVLINSNLIGAAERAANGYKDADDKVNSLATDPIVNKTESGASYGSVNEYLNAAGLTK